MLKFRRDRILVMINDRLEKIATYRTIQNSPTYASMHEMQLQTLKLGIEIAGKVDISNCIELSYFEIGLIELRLEGMDD